ncbi:MAG: gamma-glutamylcyclotransferase [Proteobacteria bacterium]|nr:gamma-glutamylcyclotransferase [Pseudomonadota bacterium]
MKAIALFCYGTLQSPLVMKAVTGQSYEGKEATLHNWARYRVSGSEYPGIIPQAGSAVSGKLYWGLDDQAVAKLDAFEGDKYERVVVQVSMADGANEEAYVYAIRNDCRKMLSDDPWDFDRFLQNGLEKFIHWFVEDRRDLFDRGDL